MMMMLRFRHYYYYYVVRTRILLFFRRIHTCRVITDPATTTLRDNPSRANNNNKITRVSLFKIQSSFSSFIYYYSPARYNIFLFFLLYCCFHVAPFTFRRTHSTCVYYYYKL